MFYKIITSRNLNPNKNNRNSNLNNGRRRFFKKNMASTIKFYYNNYIRFQYFVTTCEPI